MAGAKIPPKSLVQVVQIIYEALEPFDETSRQRIIQSVSSLLGASSTSILEVAQLDAKKEASAAQSRGLDRRASPIEMLEEKLAVTNPQKIAVFAFYRETVEGLSRFAKEDLRTYFSKAKQPVPKNYDRDFRNTVALGLIYEDGANSYLTTKGVQAVQAGFGGKGRPRGSSATNKAGHSSKRKQK